MKETLVFSFKIVFHFKNLDHDASYFSFRQLFSTPKKKTPKNDNDKNQNSLPQFDIIIFHIFHFIQMLKM